MSKSNSTTPANRARTRLLAMIRESDRIGQGFDPWPLAMLDELMGESAQSGTDGAQMDEWARLHREYLAADDAWSGALMRRPSEQRLGARRCVKLRHEIEAGDGGAILDAVSVCAAHGLVIPGWIAFAFVERHQRVVTGECRSWSDAQAFGDALPKGGNVAGLYARVQTAPWAYEVATRLLSENPNRPIDRALFEDVGTEIGAGQTKVQALIADYLDRGDGPQAPLTYVRTGLQSGLDLSAVHAKWQDDQFEAHLRSTGMKPGADGVWRKDAGTV